jgi:2-oxoglutarate ferredoxin oxidoreductase subunit delta
MRYWFAGRSSFVQKGPKMKFWRIPLDAEQIVISRGVVHVIEDRCKGCGYCVEYCPRDVLEISERFNAKGYHPPELKHPDLCVNCHYCEAICPDFAIYSVEAPAQPVCELSIQ